MSKATQTISELTESTQDFSDNGNIEISIDKNIECRNDGKVTSSNDKVAVLHKYTQVEAENVEPTITMTSQKSSYHDNDNIEEFRCGKGEMLLTSPVCKCVICNEVFVTSAELVEHERDKHWHLITGNKSEETLPIDNDTIATINNNLTERKWHGNKSVSHCCTSGVATDQTFACAVCGILYSNLNSLNTHLINVHNMLITSVANKINDASVEEITPNANQDNGFGRVPDDVAGGGDDDVVAIRKTPRRAKRFQAECPKCGKIFKCVDKWRAKEKVKRHLRTKMHGGTGIWKVCDTCGRRFKTKYLLKLHKRSPCETTVSDGDSTSGPGNLLVLREIFKCCHCVKTFSSQDKLASHEGARECFDDSDEDESETGGDGHRDWSKSKAVKPVFAASCPKCWKVFERFSERDLQAALNRHLYESKLHGGKHSWKYLCSFCGVRYQNKSRLESHMKRYHNEESSKNNAGNDEHPPGTGIDYLINSGPSEHLNW